MMFSYAQGIYAKKTNVIIQTFPFLIPLSVLSYIGTSTELRNAKSYHLPVIGVLVSSSAFLRGWLVI